MTYAALNAIFLLAALAFAALRLNLAGWLVVAKVLAPMLVLTAVFDNAIILSGIVDYQTTNISGIKIGVAPIEDFAYTLFVCVLAPTLWQKRGKK